ncbi:hypothetical protein VNI00_015871 [Paramarasmius palmivorus]
MQQALDMVPSGEVGDWVRRALQVVCASEALNSVAVWQHLVYAFVALERSYQFVNPVRHCLPSLNRPSELKPWFQEGRTNEYPKGMRKTKPFVESYWEYWSTLSPSWRTRLGERRLSRTEQGDWSSLQYPGQNGMLLPLVCLKWYFTMEAVEGGSVDWKEAAEDLLWAYGCLEEWTTAHPFQLQKAPSSSQSRPPASQSRPPASQSRPPASQSRSRGRVSSQGGTAQKRSPSSAPSKEPASKKPRCS